MASTLPDLGSVGTDIRLKLAEKAPLKSPSLTGIPLAPTASTSTNSTQIATTAFAQNVTKAYKSEVEQALSELIVEFGGTVPTN